MTAIIKKTGNRNTVSTIGILISLFILFIIFTGCITNTPFTNSTHPFPPTMTTNQSPEQASSFNYSDIRLFSPDPIKTNVSYIAKIALNDEHAKELLMHGGIIDDRAGRFHSCPKGAVQCYYPTLVIRYGVIPFYIEVDEDTGKIAHVDAQVADYPDRYSKTLGLYRTRNSTDNTVSVYNDTTLIMTYNDSSFVYLKELGEGNP